jgi:hypothetical protein
MRTIWKFELEVVERQGIEMPEDTEILCVQVQQKHPCIWALVNPEQKRNTVRWFYIYGTGHPIERSSDKIYLGTFLMMNGNAVFHLFEQDIE